MKRALAIALLLTLAGCRTGRPKIEKTLEIPSTLEITAITVDPFEFRWEEPAWRSFEVTQRVIDAAIEHSGEKVFLFGTYEATPFGEVQHRGIQSPTVALLSKYGLTIDNLVILKPWAEVRIQSASTSVKEADTGKAAGKSRDEQLTYIGHIDAVAAGTNNPIAEFKAELDVDPLAAHDDVVGDPAPDLTRLMVALTQTALESLGRSVREPANPPRALSAKLAFAPQKTFAYTVAGQDSFAQKLLKMDSLDAELARQNRVAFENPGMSEEMVSKLAATAGGLYVLSGDAALGLDPGDVISLIDDQPALPQLLQRARLAPSQSQLTIRRANGDSGVAVYR
ncbi:MAG: hypothetical protein ACJ790_16850 [Myxococcaceae bacterium]